MSDVDEVVREFRSEPTAFWNRQAMAKLIAELERRPKPGEGSFTFWLGADAPCAP